MPAAPQNFAFQEERILLGCTALKWSCINLRTGEVLIEESVGYTKDKGVYRCPPKGNKPRTVSISKRTMQMLFVWKGDQKKRGIVSQYVFTRSDGPEIMFPTTPTKHLKEIGKRCGIEDLHPHKLRHTFASVNLLEGIGDIETIAEILGHSDVSTTLKVYTHASEESKRKMSQSFHDTIHKK